MFKRILKCYELKQYKNGLKFAKQILSNPKFSEHGETLAMKGLILNCLGRKAEAYDHVRRGLRNDLRSHVCWHVYGLLQRSEKKYDEAIKCYRNALKWDRDNIQILKDLSLLQIQMRDLEGYRDTRYLLFILRPAQRLSWIGFAMAYHLLNEYEMTLKILKTFLTVSTATDFEHSELLLYQNMVYQEQKAYDEAIKHLDRYNLIMYDKLAVNETYGDLYLKVGKHEEAQQHYIELIERNQENVEYYKKLQEAMKLISDEEKFDMLKSYCEKYPHAHAPRRLALNHCQGDKFKQEIDQYLRRGLHKGVPPLFVDINSLYNDPVRVTTVETLAESYVEALKKTGYFSFEDAEKGDSPKEPASALLWTYYFLAQHYDFLRNTEKALYYIDLAIDHTPTLIELFVIKGKIHKHAGDVEEAYKWLDEAQGLDTADRYINSKCAKYMLRANLVQQAEEMCSKFTREGVSAMESLNEMQCMWFQTECALAYQRLKKWGEALKKCHEVDRHFTEIFDDQVDFHTYCMRKMTLRSYVGLLRLEDVLRSHPFYIRAAICAISVYLHLEDKPLNSSQNEHHQNTENLTPVEYKKLKLKQKRARKKAEKEKKEAEAAAAEKKEAEAPQQQQQQRPRKPGRHAAADVEQDAPKLEKLVPEKLAKVDDPLEQAIKFLKPLQLLASNRIETHLMAFEIYFRKEKPLIMLQSIKRAHRLNPSDPALHSCLVRFLLWRSNNKESLDPSVNVVIDSTLSQLIGNVTDAHELNSQFLQKYSNSLPALFEGSKMMYLLDSSRKEEAVSLATKLDDKLEGISIPLCTKIVESLQEGVFGSCEKESEEYKKLCHARYPLATAFKPVSSESASDSSISESQGQGARVFT